MNTFGTLGEDKDFTDVTLVCEDGKQVEAHKVILANSSPFFQNVLRKNKHIHPLIYMKGIKSDDLLAVIDFLYCGETNIYQENFDSFLAIAEVLQLKGLMGKSDKVEVIEEESFEIAAKPVPSALKPVSPCQPYFAEHIASTALDAISGEVALTFHFSSGNLQELDDKCISMMEKTTGKNVYGKQIYRCKVCGKEKIIAKMKDHIESSHLEGILIPCNFCEKTFRSRNLLSVHTHRNHKEAKMKYIHHPYFKSRPQLFEKAP